MQRSQPRSILKASRAHSYSEDALVNIAIPTESQSSSSQTGVRFPSTPKLSTVHYTHCPASYDRSPILVLPNSCALPARGCRDYSTTGRQEQVYGKHAHPSRIQAPSTSGSDYSSLAPPMLMQDEGSSEESDGLASPPPELALVLPQSQKQVPSMSHLYSAPLSHPPIPRPGLEDFRSYSSPAAFAGLSECSLSFLPYGPPSTPRKRDRKTHTNVKVEGFGSAWGQSDESSCLGGF